MLLSSMFLACSSNEERAKEELYTARLEIQQFADKRAKKMLMAIIAKYPKTKSAESAKAELKKLESRMKKKGSQKDN